MMTDLHKGMKTTRNGKYVGKYKLTQELKQILICERS